MPPIPGPLEQRAAKKAAVARCLYDRLMLSSVPLADREVEFLSVHLAIHPNWAETWRSEQAEWVAAGRPGADGSLLTGNPELDLHPAWIKSDLYVHGWGLLANETDIPDGRLDSLYAFFHPLDAGNSYVLAQVGVWPFIRDYCTEGRTVVVKGPPGGGKTRIVLGDLARIAHLKDEQIADPEGSTLERIRRRAYRFYRSTGTFEGGSADDDDAKDGASTEERKADRKKSQELDIINAADVAFITNLSLTGDPNNPSAVQKRNVPVSSISGSILECALRTMPGKIGEQVLPDLVFDEYDSVAPSTGTGSTAGRAHIELWRQHRHFGASMVVIGHGEKGGIPKEVFDRANTIIEKPDKHTAIYFVAGLLNFKSYSDVDELDIPYNPHGSSTLAPDVAPYQAIVYMSKVRDEAMRSGERWTHEREMQSIVDYVVELRVGDKKLKEGRDAQTLSWIDRLMDEKRSDEEIAATVGAEIREKPEHVRATLVRFMRKHRGELAGGRPDRDASKGRPEEPEEFLDRSEALTDESAEEIMDDGGRS